VNSIAELDKCEEFYRSIFSTYGLTFNTETIRQKRVFVAAIIKYFILDRLPKGCLILKEDKYEINNKKELKTHIESVIDDFYSLYNVCNSAEDFKKKYAGYFNEEVKDFSKEISENRDDSLSDFAKTIQNVYNNSKSQNDEH
jgi:hypothetical protein